MMQCQQTNYDENIDGRHSDGESQAEIIQKFPLNYFSHTGGDIGEKGDDRYEEHNHLKVGKLQTVVSSSY